MNRERLLNVARALRESPKPEKFSMELYGYVGCGTPACALGHYASRTDLQQDFRLRGNDVELKKRRPGYDSDDYAARGVSYYDAEVMEHFGLDEGDEEELFASDGCGGAITALEAAEYIERWVAEREVKP